MKIKNATYLCSQKRCDQSSSLFQLNMNAILQNESNQGNFVPSIEIKNRQEERE